MSDKKTSNTKPPRRGRRKSPTPESSVDVFGVERPEAEQGSVLPSEALAGLELPALPGAELFGEPSLVWSAAIDGGEVVLRLSREVTELNVDKRRSAFLSGVLRLLCKGAGLYDVKGSEPGPEGRPELESSEPVELGCRLERRGGFVRISSPRPFRSLRWSVRSAKYFATRLDAERQAIPRGS